MSIPLRFAKITLPIAAALALSACMTTPFRADVSRFNALPAAPAGQSFAVIAANADLAGGLEFAQYANIVAAEMAAEGFTPATNADSADLIVRVGYAVDKGEQKIFRDADPFGISFGFGFGGYPYSRYGHFGGRYHRRMSPYFFGFNDPYLFGYDRVNSVTIYTTELDVRIDRRADDMRVFEGKAMARSRTNALPKIVPNLVNAMFTDFPGNNGETVRITVAPDKK